MVHGNAALDQPSAADAGGTATPGPSQALLDAMPIAVCVSNAQGVVTHFNRHATGLWGDQLHAGVAGTILFAAPGSEPACESPLAQALRTGIAVHDATLTLERPDGTRLPLLVDAVPLRDATGEIDAVVQSFRMAQVQAQVPGRPATWSAKLRPLTREGDVPGGGPARGPVSTDTVDAAGEDRFGSICHVAAGIAGRQYGEPMCQRDLLFHRLLHALPAAIYTTDAQGRLDFFNDAAVALAGRRPLPGESWSVAWKLLRPDGTPLPHDECPMAVALRERRPIHGEEAIAERPDGSRVTFQAYPTPLFDEAGVLVGAVNMMLDVTDRKRSEQALQELNETLEQRIAERTRQAENAFHELHHSERNFALLVGSVTDYAIYMLDPHGNVSNWNAGAERIKGYRAEDVIGRDFSRFYTPEDRAAGVPQKALTIARHEGRYEAEGWRVRKDGSRFWANVIIDPIVDDGRLLGFAKITRDITQRRNAEIALVESERRARGVIDTALDGFVQLDQAGKVLEWNPRAQTMFGWSRGEAIGQPLDELIMAPAQRERYRELVFNRAHPNGKREQCEIHAVRRDGSTITVELSVSALRLNEGELLNIFIRDLTEKILLDAKLRQAQKMDAVGQLTGGIAHDFNNLLQGIIGSLDLIQLRVEQRQTADLDHFIDGAVASAKRAAAMIHRLLAFSRRQPLDPRPVKANPLIASMADLLRRTMGEQIAVEFTLAPELWTTLCDPNQLESALLNLSINARDAMPDGGRLTIRSNNACLDNAHMTMSTAHSAAEGQYICIEVADTGTGMAADVVERAFDPFYTTKPTGQGTGLGLSMVYGFARQSNGYCEILSEPGNGTRVRLCLPRHADEAVVAPAEEAPPRETANLVGAGEAVLVVEDDPVVRAVVVDVLHQLGYHALEAADGATGLDILQSGVPIDLLVSDIGLPELNGREMADAARMSRPHLKVLFMTGYAANAAAPRGFLAPGMELITKPFDTHALGMRIRDMIGNPVNR